MAPGTVIMLCGDVAIMQWDQNAFRVGPKFHAQSHVIASFCSSAGGPMIFPTPYSQRIHIHELAHIDRDQCVLELQMVYQNSGRIQSAYQRYGCIPKRIPQYLKDFTRKL